MWTTGLNSTTTQSLAAAVRVGDRQAAAGNQAVAATDLAPGLGRLVAGRRHVGEVHAHARARCCCFGNRLVYSLSLLRTYSKTKVFASMGEGVDYLL